MKVENWHRFDVRKDRKGVYLDCRGCDLTVRKNQKGFAAYVKDARDNHGFLKGSK